MYFIVFVLGCDSLWCLVLGDSCEVLWVVRYGQRAAKSRLTYAILSKLLLENKGIRLTHVSVSSYSRIKSVKHFWLYAFLDSVRAGYSENVACYQYLDITWNTPAQTSISQTQRLAKGNCIATNKVANLVSKNAIGKRTTELEIGNFLCRTGHDCTFVGWLHGHFWISVDLCRALARQKC